MATLGSNIIVAAGGGDGHVKYTDAEAVAAVHTKYTDAEAIAAVEGEATLDLAGDVDVATGKTLSADGLEFPATQVASAGANTLDDYEEGTFTPEIADDDNDGSGESQAYTTQVGRYVKVGKLVSIQINLKTSSLGSLTTTQQARIVGLPFAAADGIGQTLGVSIGDALAVGTAGYTVSGWRTLAGAATIDAWLWDATTGVTFMALSKYSSDGRFFIGGTYEAL